MTFNTGFEERGRTMENDYFRRQEREQVERLRQRDAHEATRRQLADRVGTGDDNFLDELQNAGYTPDTVALLALTPLVETAWAEGRVQNLERKAILDYATRRNIDANHPAYFKLEQWLTDRPSNEFFERSRRALTMRLESLPSVEREREASELVQACVRVAQASGGLGFINFGRRVCTEERLVLDRFINDLSKRDIETAGAATT
jgi:hypothetical protein